MKTTEEVKELINRRRRQILVHSVLYYRMDENLVSDWQYTQWTVELAELQKKYPDIAAKCVFAKEFSNFEGFSGFNLPLDDPWAVNKARQLLRLHDKSKGEKM